MGFPAIKRLVSWEWWTEPLGQKKPDPTPTSDDHLSPWERQIRTVLELPENTELVKAIHEEFSWITPFERVRVIDDVIYRFACYVFDLQASEGHHHARAYGLLEHSLQVALEAVRRMRNTSEASDLAEDVEGKGHAQLVYGSFLLGLLHDVGKCFDVEVKASDRSGVWNPNVEPLSSYNMHRSSGSSAQSPFPKYIKGRGCRAHQWRGVLLWNSVLPRAALEFLGMRLQLQLTDAWIEHCFWEKTPEVPRRAHRVVETVCSADEANTKANLPEDAGSSGKTSAAAPPEPDREVVEVPRFVERDLEKNPPTREEFVTCFKQALRFVIEKGLVPLNQSGGIFVGSRHLFISWGGAYQRLLEVMKCGGFSPARDFERMRGILKKLVRYEGWLMSDKSPLGRRLVVEGVTPYGKFESFDILKREVLEMEAPVFPGEITVYHEEDYEVLTVDEIMKRSERGDERMGYGGAAVAAEERRKRRTVLNPRRPVRRSERKAPPPPPPSETVPAPVESSAAPEEGPAPAISGEEVTHEESHVEETVAEAPPSEEVREPFLQGGDLEAELIKFHLDLTSRQELFRKRMKEQVEEYKRRVKRSRLIIFLKSREKGDPVSAVYWGIFMKTKNGSEESKRWIHHVSTPLNDTLIYKVARKQMFRHLLYDMDRRRVALNDGLHRVNKAVNCIESVLTRRGKKFGKGARKLEGPVDGPVQALLGDLDRIREDLVDLSAESLAAPSASKLRLEEPVVGEKGRPGEGGWVRADGTAIGPKMTRETLKFLGFGREDREAVMALEGRRRELRDLQDKTWRVVEKIVKAYEEAWPFSEEALREAEKTKVDRYGQPIEDIDEPMTEEELGEALKGSGVTPPDSGGDGEFPDQALEDDELGEDVDERRTA